MTPDELPADMEALIECVALPWIEAEEMSVDPEDLAKAGQAVRALLKAYHERGRALKTRTPASEGEAWRTVPVEPTADMRRAFDDARPDTAVQDGEGGWTAPWTDWFRAKYAAMLAASPVVPVGVRERVLDELDKAWLHGQRRTSWRRDESADAILAAIRLDTGWRDIATAPRDGTDVLVCDDETGERHVSYWTGDCWSGRNRFKPTHWMPLPPAPTDTGRE